MNLALTIILILSILFMAYLIRSLILGLKGFELLLEKFVEINQEFYEGQKNVIKKDKEVVEAMVKQTTELGIVRKYVNQISNPLKNITESTRILKECQREIKSSCEELNVSKSIAQSLAQVSNNIGILDKIVNDLKRITKN